MFFSKKVMFFGKKSWFLTVFGSLGRLRPQTWEVPKSHTPKPPWCVIAQCFDMVWQTLTMSATWCQDVLQSLQDFDNMCDIVSNISKHCSSCCCNYVKTTLCLCSKTLTLCCQQSRVYTVCMSSDTDMQILCSLRVEQAKSCKHCQTSMAWHRKFRIEELACRCRHHHALHDDL